VDRESSRLIANSQIELLGDNIGSIMVSGGNEYSLQAARHLIDVPLGSDWQYILDYEIPFYQMVVRGFIEYAGMAHNIRQVQDPDFALLNMLAFGASPHYMWTHAPTSLLAHTPFTHFYSTQYRNWIDIAIEQYHTYNAIFQNMGNVGITDFQILHSSGRGRAVTMTEYGNQIRVFVNTTRNDFEADGIFVPSMDYYVEDVAD